MEPEPVIQPEGPPVIKVEPPQQVYEEKKKIVLEKRIIWYICLVIEALLLVLFLLQLFDANVSIFTVLINILTFPFVFLFKGLFETEEFPTLFAMFVYAVLALVVSRFFRLKKPIDPKEADKKVEMPIV
jgi:hypothetical protein